MWTLLQINKDWDFILLLSLTLGAVLTTHECDESSDMFRQHAQFKCLRATHWDFQWAQNNLNVNSVRSKSPVVDVKWSFTNLILNIHINKYLINKYNTAYSFTRADLRRNELGEILLVFRTSSAQEQLEKFSEWRRQASYQCHRSRAWSISTVSTFSASITEQRL